MTRYEFVTMDRRTVAATGSTTVTWRAPFHYSATIAAELIAIPRAGAAADERDIDLTLVNAAVGEQDGHHTTTDTMSTYDLSNKLDCLVVIPVTPLCDAIGEQDYCTLTITHNEIGGAVDYVGLRWVYSVYR